MLETYNVDVIIEKLVCNKVNEDGKVIYPALRQLFKEIERQKLVVAVAFDGTKMHVDLCTKKTSEVMGSEHKHIYYECKRSNE